MLKVVLHELKPALLTLIALTLLTGLAYPALVTGAAQVLFPRQASGSIISAYGKAIGSELIGQNFSAPKYFWGRPSATMPMPCNAGSSSGSNQGPTNPALIQAVKDRIAVLQSAAPDNMQPIPVDLVTASGSGLDPHISPAAANFQAARVAKARKVPLEKVAEILERFTEGRQLGVLGEARVNVLKLNLALDEMSRMQAE